MLEKNIKPYSNALWDYGCSLSGTNLISASKEKLTLCLLPRTLGTYSRNGFSVNKMHYKNDAFKEKYLSGGDAIVAYDPDNSNYVWVIEKGEYIRFDLIESRFKDKSVQDVQLVQDSTKLLIKSESNNRLQSEIDLASHIQSIVETTAISSIIGSSGIGKTSAIQKALNLISGGQIIEIEKPFSKIIHCLQVQCPYDASPKGLLLEILRNVDSVLGTKYYERSRKASDTTDGCF